MEYKVEKLDGNICLNGKKAKIYRHPYKTGGCSRAVYTVDDLILKIDIGYRKEVQGRKEVYYLEKIIEKQDKKYFPKILGWGELEDGSFWIVEKFEKIERPQRKSNVLERLILKYGIKDVQQGRFENWNWGRCGKYPLIFDFGM